MDNTWINLKPTYYIGKILGLFPLAGNCKNVSLFYTLILWILVTVLSIYLGTKTYVSMMDRVSTQPFLMNMVNIMISFKLIVALLCVVFSIHRSKGFFKLIEEFNGFDSYTLQLSCPSDLKVQTFYLLYAVLIETYYFVISVNYSLLSVSILVSWTLISVATMLMMIQYAVFVRILRERYKWANYIFACNIKDSWACPQLMYPNEITSLYNELRLLTEEVKNYYALHAILVITDSVLIFTACVTAMTLNYTNKSSKSLFADNLFLIYCLSKLLFVFFIVRETHNTMQEANKTVLIAHEALSITTNTVVMKEFEVLIMTCWNHPIVFDVYDFFNLDYKLLQSIIAAVVTYLVVLIQIQLAISSA